MVGIECSVKVVHFSMRSQRHVSASYSKSMVLNLSSSLTLLLAPDLTSCAVNSLLFRGWLLEGLDPTGVQLQDVSRFSPSYKTNDGHHQPGTLQKPVHPRVARSPERLDPALAANCAQ